MSSKEKGIKQEMKQETAKKTKKKTLILSGCLVVDNKNENILLLMRKDHRFYETPGGKMKEGETLEETALRELKEEVGGITKIKSVEYFGNIKFTVPDGREAVANKFIVKIPSSSMSAVKVNEPDNFMSADWLPVKDLDKYPLSPDLKVLAPEIKKRLLK